MDETVLEVDPVDTFGRIELPVSIEAELSEPVTVGTVVLGISPDVV